MGWIAGILGILAAGAAAVFSVSSWEHRQLTVTTYRIRDKRFDANDGPVRFAVLADLHNHVFGKDNQVLLDKIAAADPAAVLIAGDMITAHHITEKKRGSTAKEGGGPQEKAGSKKGSGGKDPTDDFTKQYMEHALSLLEKLAARYPVCYGVGNHEQRLFLYPENYGNAGRVLRARLAAMGLSLMENSDTVIMAGNVPVRVTGCVIDRRYYRRLKKTSMAEGYLDGLLPEKDPSVYTILLAHDPEYFRSYVNWGADLTLAGHLHGGLVRLFGRGVASADLSLFPKYSGGMYTEGGKRMIVSRGLGSHTIPLRLFNKPELVIVELAGDSLCRKIKIKVEKMPVYR